MQCNRGEDEWCMCMGARKSLFSRNMEKLRMKVIKCEQINNKY